MTIHAKLSPSGAHRWRNCPSSVHASQGVAEESSKYADEGTAAHTLAAWCLEQGVNAAEFEGRLIPVEGRNGKPTTGWPASPMVGPVQEYVDNCRAWVDALDDGIMFVEVEVPISQITGEEGATGTSDCIIVGTLPAEGRQVLVCRDLKFGQGVSVSAVENDQQIMYAGGAIEHLGFAYDFDDGDLVVMEIDQPRKNNVSTWQITVGELRERLAAVAEDAKRVLAAGPDDCRNPGDWCRWCPIRATCEARMNQVSRLTTGSDGFSAPLTEQAKKPDPDRLGEYYGYVDMVRQWCKDVEEEVHRRLLAGIPVDGWKLVAGKLGNRTWAVEGEELERSLLDLGLDRDTIYTAPSVKSPAQLEKSLPKPEREKLAPLVKRAEGKPTVAPDSDPRPEYNAASSDGFATEGIDDNE